MVSEGSRNGTCRGTCAWDITDREDSFGYTLSLQEVDEDGNWTMLNSFNQDDEDEDWNDDENEDGVLIIPDGTAAIQAREFELNREITSAYKPRDV